MNKSQVESFFRNKIVRAILAGVFALGSQWIAQGQAPDPGTLMTIIAAVLGYALPGYTADRMGAYTPMPK